VDLNGTGPARDPGRKNEVGIPDSVIGMQMRDEGCLKLREVKSLHSLPIGRRGSADDAWAQVNEVWGVVDDDGGRGPDLSGSSTGADNVIWRGFGVPVPSSTPLVIGDGLYSDCASATPALAKSSNPIITELSGRPSEWQIVLIVSFA